MLGSNSPPTNDLELGILSREISILLPPSSSYSIIFIPSFPEYSHPYSMIFGRLAKRQIPVSGEICMQREH